MPSVPFASVLSHAATLVSRLTTVRPREAKFTIGLDVGSTSVKAVALGPRKGLGARPLAGQHVLPLQAGQEADASEAIKAAVGALKLPTRSVNVAVSGQWVIMRVVEMPVMKPHELKQALPFEAQRYLPFNVQDVVLDGVVLGPAAPKKQWVLIVACKKELIERRMDWLKRAGCEAALIDVDALALTNAFQASGAAGRRDGIRALINVGGQHTNLVILQGELPYLVRDIPWGADKLIRGVAEQLGAEPAAVSDSLVKGQVAPELSRALDATAQALADELQLSFDYFENRFGQPPEEVCVSGGVGQSAVFLDSLKRHLTQALTPWTPGRGLTGQFAVAYGLALRSA
ncbi:MAG: pilus assembly protein PilM [Candidatus Omnitrophica bacterium]|nr:pilus assembly protein PilM [Candidatus Omnitrophota bacterium]